MTNSKKMLLLSAAVAGLGLASCATKTNLNTAVEGIKGECHGINSCKGSGDCGGKGYSCAGKNSCKGKGWLKLTAGQCMDKKGTFKK